MSEHKGHAEISTARLEAFSDAVMAIVITIAVLSIKIPDGASFESIKAILPVFVVYAISFQAIGIYWNNHHHLLKAVKHISAGIMWANLYLLFWLSLIPVVTLWLGGHYLDPWPTALYSFVLLMCAIAYNILSLQIISHSEHKEGILAEFRKKPKGMVSLIMYVLALVTAFYLPLASYLFIILVALAWFIPDQRIERQI